MSEHLCFVKEIYGDSWISFFHILEDAAGNTIIYSGSKELAEKGATVAFKATVKRHGERDGAKQTVVARPQVLEKKPT